MQLLGRFCWLHTEFGYSALRLTRLRCAVTHVAHVYVILRWLFTFDFTLPVAFTVGYVPGFHTVLLQLFGYAPHCRNTPFAARLRLRLHYTTRYGWLRAAHRCAVRAIHTLRLRLPHGYVLPQLFTFVLRLQLITHFVGLDYTFCWLRYARLRALWLLRCMVAGGTALCAPVTFETLVTLRTTVVCARLVHVYPH